MNDHGWSAAAAITTLVFAFAIDVLVARPTLACDICALHTSTVLDPPRPGFSIHLTEQYTSFNTYKATDGRSLPVDEWLQSSITNVVVGYGFVKPFRVELTAPFINREFYRLKDQAIDRGDVSGLGDVTILGRFTAVDRVLSDASLVRIELFAGFELPTGDTDELEEEEEDEDAEGASHSSGTPSATPLPKPRHGGHSGPTGIHDQDLALGSGSLDAILGINAFATYRRFFGATGFQYAVRGNGDHDYRYDNDLSFHFGVGGYLLTHSVMSLGVEARLTGETKGNDKQHGETLTGSNLTALYVGPQIHATYAERARFALGVQLPVLQNVSELQLVPDYRILASVGWQF